MEQRKKKIADGLSAAELGEQALEKAKIDVDSKLSEAKSEAKNIISMAEKRQSDILDEANVKASEETSKKITDTPVWISGIGQKTTSAGFTKNESLFSMNSSKQASESALKMGVNIIYFALTQ